MTIIFYDIPSQASEKAWSPNTWKARFVLNYKRIPYITEWIEFPDIEAHCKNLGIPPSSTTPSGGNPFYTLPAIHDPSTGAYVSESLLIAEYLEKTYPETPSVFPYNSLSLQASFHVAFRGNLKPFWVFGIPAAFLKLNPASAGYYRRTREATFQKPMEEVLPQGEEGVVEWAKVRDAMGKVDGWYAKNDDEGPFLMGESPSWADFFVVSYLVFMKVVWGEDKQEWKDVMSWHGGRWKGLLEAVEEYTTVH